MPRDSTWTNPYGLVVGFGTHTPDNEIAGVHQSGSVRTLSMLVDLVNLEDTDSITAASFDARAAIIPRGSHIESATIQVTALATSGGAATLDIGLYDSDFSSVTVDDANGIDIDIAVTAIDALGDIVICDGALVNGVVSTGATSNSDTMVILGFEAAAFTAGQVLLTLQYITPQVAGRTIAS